MPPVVWALSTPCVSCREAPPRIAFDSAPAAVAMNSVVRPAVTTVPARPVTRPSVSTTPSERTLQRDGRARESLLILVVDGHGEELRLADHSGGQEERIEDQGRRLRLGSTG